MFRSRGSFVSLGLILALAYSIPSEAFFFRALGGLFGGGRRNRVIPRYRHFNNGNGGHRFFNPNDPFGLGLGHGNFGQFGFGLNPFADPIDPFGNSFAFGNGGFGDGNSRQATCQQVRFESAGSEWKPWACTAQLASGAIIDVSGSNKLDAIRNIKLDACNRGADPLAIDKWHTTCRRKQGDFVEQWGDFAGDFTPAQIVVGTVDEPSMTRLWNWLRDKKGTTQWFRFQGRRLAQIHVPPGEEAAFCQSIREWDQWKSITSCNPNVYVQGTGNAGGIGTLAGAVDPQFNGQFAFGSGFAGNGGYFGAGGHLGGGFGSLGLSGFGGYF